MLEYDSNIHMNKQEFDDLMGRNFQLAQFVKYFGADKESDFALFTLPTLSDSPEFAMLKFKRYIDKGGKAGNYKNEILSHLRDLAIAEYNRIVQVRGRTMTSFEALKRKRDAGQITDEQYYTEYRRLNSTGEGIREIKYFDSRGHQFVNFPFLNDFTHGEGEHKRNIFDIMWEQMQEAQGDEAKMKDISGRFNVRLENFIDKHLQQAFAREMKI